MGTQLPPPKKKGAYSPQFLAYVLWPNGCMYQGTTWYTEEVLSLGDVVLDGDPAPDPLKRHPQFSAKFRFDPSNILAIIHQRHRQTGQERQDNGPIA